MKRRTLTPDEERLWSHVTRGDMPIETRAYVEDKTHRKIRLEQSRTMEAFAYPAFSAGDAAVMMGNYAGIDRNTADRFRKGELPLDASIDLHGMNRERAYKALIGFVKAHYDAGSRFVLVITGKGSTSGGVEKAGVLRELLPQWLDDSRLAPLVLAFDGAKQKHGGSGAFYILLRRNRGY